MYKYIFLLVYKDRISTKMWNYNFRALTISNKNIGKYQIYEAA